MIKVSVLYPYMEGATFNIDYYVNRHCPTVRDTLGAACKGIAIEQGLSGPAPGSHPHGPKFMADIPNYTAIEPRIQISEVKA